MRYVGKEKIMYDVIIIGAGTAGLSASIYTSRAGKSTLLLEGYLPGGQIVSSKEIENYPGIKHISGADFASALYEQALSLGATIKYENATSIEGFPDKKVVRTDQATYECKSIIIATGATKRALGLEREQELTGLGVSYCAVCDGAFFKGKEVAVVGGGNTAVEDAIFLSAYCKKVYLIHRKDSFRAESRLVETLEARENVSFILESVATKLHGEGRLEGIDIKSKSGEETFLPLDGLFVAIGQIPANDFCANMVALDPEGYIIAGENCKTNAEGIFVAGDCRTKTIRQLTTASSDGTIAGLAACEYIDGLTH